MHVNQIRAQEDGGKILFVLSTESDETTTMVANEMTTETRRTLYSEGPSDDPVIRRVFVKQHVIIRPAPQERPNLGQSNAGILLAKSPLFRQKAASPDHKMLHFG